MVVLKLIQKNLKEQKAYESLEEKIRQMTYTRKLSIDLTS